VHRKRKIRACTDRHGVGHMSLSTTADELARLVGQIDSRCDDIVVDAIKGRWFESREAHRVDALVDLILTTFGRTQVTKLEDLAHLCPFHHYLKTFCGYTYAGGPGTWRWIPPEYCDVLAAYRKVIAGVRRW
jgi:hypothetical protein